MKSLLTYVRRRPYVLPTFAFVIAMLGVVVTGIAGIHTVTVIFSHIEILTFVIAALSWGFYLLRPRLIKNRITKQIILLQDYYKAFGFDTRILSDTFNTIDKLAQKAYFKVTRPKSSQEHIFTRATQVDFPRLRKSLPLIESNISSFGDIGGYSNITTSKLGTVPQLFEAPIFAHKFVEDLKKRNPEFTEIEVMYPAEVYALFACLSGKTKNIDYDRFLFFYRNKLSPATYIETMNFSMKTLESFAELPDSWIQEALLGEKLPAPYIFQK